MALAPFAFGAVASAGLASVPPARPAAATRTPADTRCSTAGPGSRASASPSACSPARSPSRSGWRSLWRFDGVAGSHQQPEVADGRGRRAGPRQGPGPVPQDRPAHHQVKYHTPGEPDTPGFLPYLPLMAVLGHPERHLAQQRPQRRAHLLLRDDARGGRGRALSVPGRRAPQDPRAPGPASSCPSPHCRWPRGATTSRSSPSCSWRWCWRSAAVRSRPGIVLGIASAMKFTAWPLAAAHAVRRPEPQGRTQTAHHVGRACSSSRCRPSSRSRCAARSRSSMTSCSSRSGLSAIPSTAASALPGHELVLEFPSLEPGAAALGRVRPGLGARPVPLQAHAQHRVAGVQHHGRRHVRR